MSGLCRLLAGVTVKALRVLKLVLQFERESVLAKETVEMAVVATGFKVRPYFGDFNAVLALRERYRKNTRISDVVDIFVLFKGCVN